MSDCSPVKDSKTLSVVVGETFIVTEGCERRYNGRFLFSDAEFIRGNSEPVDSTSDGPQWRDYKFTPRRSGELTITYQVTRIGANGDLVRETTYDVGVRNKEL